MLGKRLGPYEILEELGSGGMATVYRAYHPAMDRFVAIKVLKDILAFDKASLERFKDEARIIARLEHPHLLPIYDYAADTNSAYIVMRYLEGTSLKAILDSNGALPFHEIVHVCRQVSSALDYAHARGVIHRDIKPANILFDTDGNCFLTDFGIAGVIGDRKSFQKGLLLGTPAYMSPEQVRGQEKLGTATDVYSLGAVIFEMATGRMPYEAPMMQDVMRQHLYMAVPSARALNPDLPNGIDKFFLQALSKTPNDRFASAGEMRRELEKMLAPNEAFRPPSILRKVAKAESQARQEMQQPSEHEAITYNVEVERNPIQKASRAVKDKLIQVGPGSDTEKRRRGTFLYYLILLLFFVISVLLLIGFIGLPKSENARMTEIAQTRAVLELAQARTATMNASQGIFPSPSPTIGSSPEVLASPSSEPTASPSETARPTLASIPLSAPTTSPSPIPTSAPEIQPTSEIVISSNLNTASTGTPSDNASVAQVGLAYLNLPEAEAVLVFPQMAIYSVDKAFDVELNPLGSSSESAHIFAAPESSLVVTAVDERGLHLNAAQNSFFVTDSGDYTSGIEFGFQNLPEIFVSMEAGQTCAGIYALSDNVLYFDCLAGACSYRIGIDGSKRPVPAGQRLVAGFPNQATERIIAIPDSAILQYESFLYQSPDPANYLDCLDSYLVSTSPNNAIPASSFYSRNR